MKLALAEVFEVATFYAHFDIVKEGEPDIAAAHRPRLRQRSPARCSAARSCSHESAEQASGPASASCARPASGCCDSAPVAEVGHRYASSTRPLPKCSRRPRAATPHPHHARPMSTTTPMCRMAATSCSDDLRAGELSTEDDPQGARRFRPARARRRRAFRPGANGARCCGEPGPRLMAVNADEGEPGTFKDRYLSRDAIRTASSRAC